MPMGGTGQDPSQTRLVTDPGEVEQLRELPVEGAHTDAAGSVAPTPAVGDPTARPYVPGDLVVDVEHAVSRNELVAETLLPVCGLVRLTAREVAIVDHPAFQRLFEIFQLGQTHLVYRGATHMRGEHAVGCVHMVTMMIDATRRNASRGSVTPSEHWQRASQMSDTEVAFARLGALLHDIGHLPAGHTLEDELGLLARHDGDERIDMILDRTDWHGRRYLSLRSVIDREYDEEAQDAGQRDADGRLLTPAELLVRLVSSDHKNAATTPGTNFRVGVCRDLIANTICADLLDYLHRDWLHLGKPRHFDPRLLDYLEIVTRTPPGGEREDRLVINLRGAPRPRTDAVTAILDLLESRYQLSEIALFHRVKLAATGMLERVVAEYCDTFPDQPARRGALEQLMPELLECSDTEMLNLFERKLLERRSEGETSRVDGAVDLARRLRVRKLYRDLQIFYEDDLGGPERATAIAGRFAGERDVPPAEERTARQRASENRLLTLRKLEHDFGLAPGELVMYCPSMHMNTKLAEVGIYIRGQVDSLARFDERNTRITGGHLAAQQLRFRRLWRISFAIKECAYAELEKTGLLRVLQKAIKELVLWTPESLDGADEPHDVREVAKDIAREVVRTQGSPWYGHDIIEPALNREQPGSEYVGGAPSISSCIDPRPPASQPRT
jgi:uncharacterized protein